jgi:amidohydrolase
MIDFLQKTKEIEDTIIDIRRDLHQNPELGFELYRTNEKVKEFLDNEGIKYVETAKTGICAIIKGKISGKTVAIRGDMDALPLEEKNSCEYASKVRGRMHACGHDAHTAMLLGAAKILNSCREELKGNVKLFFEPAEETVGGARFMIEEGVLENPKVDAVIGLHVEEWLDAGKIGIKRDVVNAASNPFKIKIIGSGGHGASPHTAIDPIVIASNVIVSLQNIISREIPPTDAAVITIGSIHGGTAQNIIPEYVTVEGIMRTVKTEHREYVKKRLIEVTEGVVTSMRGKCEIEIEESYPCLYNDEYMTDLLVNAASKVIGSKNIEELRAPSMGVESFAYFAMERPSVFYYLGCRNEEKGITHAAHSNLFDIDEDCLAVGTAIHCQAAWDFLNEGNV